MRQILDDKSSQFVFLNIPLAVMKVSGDIGNKTGKKYKIDGTYFMIRPLDTKRWKIVSARSASHSVSKVNLVFVLGFLINFSNSRINGLCELRNLQSQYLGVRVFMSVNESFMAYIQIIGMDGPFSC